MLVIEAMCILSFNILAAREVVGNHAVHQLPLFCCCYSVAGILPL